MLKGRKLLIGIPSYDGKVVVEFATAFAQSLSHLLSLGVTVYHTKKIGSCYIDQARDEIVHAFLHDSDATDLLFIDADVTWEPDAISRLMIAATKHEAACGMYPLKLPEPAFTANVPIVDGGVEMDGGLIRADGVPAGFLMVRRSAIEKMVEAYPELSYRPMRGKLKDQKVAALFHMNIEDERYYREDIAFCRRLAAVADGVWIDPDIELKHWNGVECFAHKFKDYILRVDPGMWQERLQADAHGKGGVRESGNGRHQPGPQPQPSLGSELPSVAIRGW